jgi:hypothetical protein
VPSQEFETAPPPMMVDLSIMDGMPDAPSGTGDIRPMTGVITPLAPTSGPKGVPVILDPSDPFDRALIPIVEVSHRKRADYATDGSPFDNFRITAEFAGFEGGWVSALFNVQQKLARVQALRANGRAGNPQNEALDDTILDAATYSILALAIWLEEKAAASG